VANSTAQLFQPLQNGVNYSNTAAEIIVPYISVPPGQTNLTITVSNVVSWDYNSGFPGFPADMIMLVNAGGVGGCTWTYGRTMAFGDTITIPNPRASDYYISVWDYWAYISCPYPASVGPTIYGYNVRAIFAPVIYVPGTANPWLAGMPDGSVSGLAQAYDTAPSNSPVQVAGFAINGGGVFTFSATGVEAHAHGYPLVGADGDVASLASRSVGAENGIADLLAPFDALLGVFLDDHVPSNFSAPGTLDFSTGSERDFLTLHPALRQPFFIGDGLTSSGVTQQFIAPGGATRLFLGPMDSWNWADNVGGFTVTVTVVPPPTITTQPQSHTVNAGSTVFFSVTASGQNLNYQWFKDGTLISGANTSVYTITGTLGSKAGSYQVQVSNLAGGTWSEAATLTVFDPVVISQPQPTTVAAAREAIFSVSASGTAPFSYQWRNSGSNITGASGASYTNFNAQISDTGDYDVVVTNVYGSVTSTVATLTVVPAITFAARPASQSVLAGGNANLAAVADGPGLLQYQWFVNGVLLAGQTNASVAFTNVLPSDAGTYGLRVTNPYMSTNSTLARLTVTVTNPVVTPIALTGWNRDVILENATTPFAQAFDSPASFSVLFEEEWNGHADGLPSSRQFVSAINYPSVLFELQPYNANNVLWLSTQPTTNLLTGTLTLLQPKAYVSLSIVAASAFSAKAPSEAGAYGSLVLNFSDGTHSGPISFLSLDWGVFLPSGLYGLMPIAGLGEIEYFTNGTTCCYYGADTGYGGRPCTKRMSTCLPWDTLRRLWSASRSPAPRCTAVPASQRRFLPSAGSLRTRVSYLLAF